MKNELAVCNKCGWIHFKVSTKYVFEWLRDWTENWIRLSQEGRENYGCPYGPPSTEQYQKCHRCNNVYTDFRDSAEEDEKRSYGHTIGPILDSKETLEE